jgi:methylenetetrahydrofolate reductase (NADPH)
MKISDMLTQRQTFSFEIFPPKGELSVDQALGIAGELTRDRPDYVSVTFSAGGSGSSENTPAIARRLQSELDLTALAHFTCMGATKADVDAYANELMGSGVENVLALRGDHVPGRPPVDFAHATDLIAYLKASAPDLCVGGACYPEGHVECEDFSRSMEHLKAKQDAGVDFLVSQLFFDNEYYYRFREACDKARIKVPVVCGIMPFTSVRQIQRMAFTCGATIPSRVIKRLVSVGDDTAAMREAGIEYACDQLCDLGENGVDGVHVYTMNKPEVAHAAHAALLASGYLKD